MKAIGSNVMARPTPFEAVKVLRFLAAGGFTTALHYLIFSVSVYCLPHSGPSVSLFVAYSVSLPTAYVFQRKVFGREVPHKRAILRFALTYAAPVPFNWLFLELSANLFGLNPLLIQAVWTIVSSGVRFALLRGFVFSKALTMPRMNSYPWTRDHPKKENS